MVILRKKSKLKKIVLATGNQGKAQEIKDYFQGNALDIEWILQTDLKINSAPETASTFVENALIKARHAAEKSGLPVLADDSGLIVDCLQGEPGIYSARYSDADDCQTNIQKVIHNIQALSLPSTTPLTARFVCVLVLLSSPKDPLPWIAEGIWEGEITLTPQGNYGFGYDPIFYLPAQKCVAAELLPADKNKISHRAQALKKLVQRFVHHGVC